MSSQETSPKATSQDSSLPPVENHEVENLQEELPVWRLTVIVVCLATGLFLSLMDTAIVSTAIVTIATDFDDYARAVWVTLAYTLSYIGTAVFFTRLSDVFGRKTMVLSSFTIFSAFSLACGFAQTLDQLVVFRGFQGIGGAGLYSLTMVVFPEISPPKVLPMISGIIGMVVAISGVCGPILGGVITHSTTWRWIFWLNGPPSIICGLSVFLVWPKGYKSGTAKPVLFKHLDFLGAILSGVGSVFFVFCIEETGIHAFEWNSPVNLAFFIIAFFAWAIFFTWQWYIGRSKLSNWMVPQLPFRLLLTRVMSAGFLGTFLTGYVLLLSIFNIPLRAQVVDSASSIQAALRLLPLLVATAVGSVLGGGASSKTKLLSWSLMAASSLMALGTGLLSSLPSDGSFTNAQYGYEVILGLGLGITMSAITVLTSITVEPRDHAVAQGTISQSRILGGSIGIAVSTMIMNRHIESAVGAILSADQLTNVYRSPLGAILYGAEIQEKVRLSLIPAFTDDMRICMYLSLVALVASAFTWQRNPPTRLRGHADVEEEKIRSETPTGVLEA